MLNKRSTFHNIILQIGILGYVFTLPYHAKFNSLFLIILIINWLISPDLILRINQALSNKFVLLLISVYVSYVLGMLYTSNIAAGTKLLIRDFSLVFWPMLLSTTSISESLKRRVYLTFFGTLFMATVACYYLFYNNYLVVNDFYLTFSQGHFRDNFLKYLPIRPTYLTLYIMFSVITIVELIKYYLEKKIYISVILLLIIIIYFVFTAFLLSARMPLLAGLLLFIFLITKYSLKEKYYWGIAAGLLFVICIANISYNNPYFNNRFKETIETTLKPPTGMEHNSTNIRVGIVYCTYQLIKKNWLLGVGTGDSQDFLNKCYKDSGFSSLMYQDSYNTHNAFLEIWLKNGVLSCMLLLIMFVLPLYISFKHNSVSYFAFLFIFILTSITESTLNLQKGVVFFSFFNSLLAFNMSYFKAYSTKKQ